MQENINQNEGKKTKKHGLVGYVLGFITRSTSDHVFAYAATAAFFLFISFIPFVLFLTTLLKHTGIPFEVMRDTILKLVPENLAGFVVSILSEAYNRGKAIVPVSILLVLWSSGKAVHALLNGVNVIYHVEETRNWLVNRIIAVLYTILLGIALIASMIILVLGRKLQMILIEKAPLLAGLLDKLLSGRFLLVAPLLFAIFLVAYVGLPNRKCSIRSQMPGALFTTIGWMILSAGFSWYFKLVPSMQNMYGSLTALTITMIWMYYCMVLIMIGAEINTYFELEFRGIRKVIRMKRENMKEERRRSTWK